MKYFTPVAVPDGVAALVLVRVLQLLLVVEVARVVAMDVVAAVPGTHWAGNNSATGLAAVRYHQMGEHGKGGLLQ
jgi:hypothetical protein